LDPAGGPGNEGPRDRRLKDEVINNQNNDNGVHKKAHENNDVGKIGLGQLHADGR
jgi:hypothetical protein